MERDRCGQAGILPAIPRISLCGEVKQDGSEPSASAHCAVSGTALVGAAAGTGTAGKEGGSTGMITAIYARQSVDKKDSLSIRGQVELCRKEVEGEFRVYQDRGFSGKDTARPSFQRMMVEVQQGQISRIVVYRLDRFSRSIADFGRVWELLQQRGVEFSSVSERFDTSTPMGRAMLHIIMVFAQLERETIAQRVRDNYYQRVQQGSWMGGPAPYGFCIVRRQEQGRSYPVAEPDGRADGVRRIYELYAQPEQSLGSVAMQLSQEGDPGPHGKGWDSASLSRLLRNPVYVQADEAVWQYYQQRDVKMAAKKEDFDGTRGGLLVGKRGGSLPDMTLSLSAGQGIVPSYLWLKCQKKLEHNRQMKRTGRGSHSWLSGLLRCGGCGYAVQVVATGGRRYLRCSGRSNRHVCTQHLSAGIDCLEQAVEQELIHLLGEDETVRKEWEEICAKIQRLLYAVEQSDDITFAYYDAILRRLHEQKRQLEQQMQQQVQAWSVEQKYQAAQLLVEKILVWPDRAEVFWKV